MDPKGAVEAALFSSHEPLRVADIAERVGIEEGEVRNAINQLTMEYERRDSPIKIAKIGPEYVMQLRDEYREYAMKFSEQEISPGALKTVVTIAYHQPIMQSELVRTLGPRVYDDVRLLEDMDLIYARPKGQTRELTTTKYFSEYFGIEGTSKEAIRKWIDKTEKK